MHSCMIIHYIVKKKNHLSRYCLQAFTTTEKLKCYMKDCFKINRKQNIKMPKKGDYIKFENFGRKRKSPIMIYADFESILVPEDDRK